MGSDNWIVKEDNGSKEVRNNKIRKVINDKTVIRVTLEIEKYLN